jgi:hypothetical protein
MDASMTKEEVLALLAQKTKQMQDLFDQAQQIADDNKVVFQFTLQARARWSDEKAEILAGAYEPKGSDKYDGENEHGVWDWENSSLNC